MFLIKACPSCGTGLRFPIDKGKIRVRCACGHDFIADPDNPGLYTDARFDVRHDTRKRGSTFRRFGKLLERLDIGKTRTEIITGLLSIKYRLQNFRLLPGAEQRRIAFVVVIILLALALIGHLVCGRSVTPEDEGIFL